MAGYNKNKHIKLKAIMLEKGYTQNSLAKKLNMSTQALNAKLNGRSAFSITEAEKISRILEIENPTVIFFPEYCVTRNIGT